VRSYGTIRRVDRHWEIEAEPHVAITLKRVLARASAATSGAVTVSDTPQVARDLQWVMARYRMRLSLPDLHHLDAQACRQRAIEEAVVSIQAGGYLSSPDFLQPAVQPRPHQLEESDILLATGHRLVVHAAGLGKTFTCLLGLRDPRARPALAVTLGGTMPVQWQRQAARFFPTLGSYLLPVGAITDEVLERLHAADLLIMPYSRLDKYFDHLRGHVRYVAFDEVQELRRRYSAKYVAAQGIAEAADFRMGASATPIYGYGGESYNVIDPLAPGVLGDYEEFSREWWGHAAGRGGLVIREINALGSHLQELGIMGVKTREQVGMPTNDPIIVPHDIDVDTAVIEQAEADVADIARRLLDGGEHTSQERFGLASELDWKMREATGIAKAPHVADLVRLLLEGEQRVLLFGWHHAVYEIWLERLWSYGVARFTGQETPKRKAQELARFMGGDARVLMMSLRAGAGIDGLQEHCSVVVFGELDWAPGVHKQNIWRLDRPDWSEAAGMDRLVTAYFCTTEAGSDPLMTEVLGLKEQQAGGLVNAARDLRESPLMTNADRVRRLAESVLQKRGS
jgi:hypothetical protein